MVCKPIHCGAHIKFIELNRDVHLGPPVALDEVSTVTSPSVKIGRLYALTLGLLWDYNDVFSSQITFAFSNY